MVRSHRALAKATALGIFCFWPSAVALAANDAPKEPNPLKAVLDTRAEGNDVAADAQKRIDVVSDETDDLLRQYRSVLKQIESIDVYNRQMQSLLEAQQAEIASLVDQVSRVQGVGRSVTPLMLRMVDALDKFVELDIPFLAKERAERIDGLREMMGRADVTTAEKFRRIMEAYQIENEYGRTIEAYRASLTLDGRESTVDFLRFGRIALVYQALDESHAGRWDQASGSWMPLDSGHRSSLRNGLRIARKQSAPDLIRLPLAAPTDARESK